MRIKRRFFLQSAMGMGMGTMLCSPKAHASQKTVDTNQLDEAAKAPVLQLGALTDPVIIKSIELYRFGNNHLVRTTSRDGAVGFAMTNSRAKYLHPILNQLVIPFFIGKDARLLESLIDGVYVYNSNYKLSGLALWNCVAWVEFSILDLLGKISKQHVSGLFGRRVRDEIPVYRASGNRDTTPEEEVEILQKLVDESGVRAIKFKVGGRMRDNQDSIPGRSEALIPLVRKAFGGDFTIHSDSNGSYDAEMAIKIGRMCQEQNFHFFEEPCPFDHLEETKRVADALDIPIAGGEQETSLRRFCWMIDNDAVQVVQPDLHYNGGMIRATRVARMAALKNMPITVHMSGGGTGFVDMLNFASLTPTIGAFQEYKGDLKKVSTWYDPPLRLKDGAINAPSGHGMGIASDEEFMKGAEKVVS